MDGNIFQTQKDVVNRLVVVRYRLKTSLVLRERIKGKQVLNIFARLAVQRAWRKTSPGCLPARPLVFSTFSNVYFESDRRYIPQYPLGIITASVSAQTEFKMCRSEKTIKYTKLYSPFQKKLRKYIGPSTSNISYHSPRIRFLLCS